MHEAEAVGRNGLAEIVLRPQSMLALDPYRVNAATGRFMLVDNFAVVGGVTSIEGFADERAMLMDRPGGRFVVEHRVTTEARAARAGHRGAVFWLTGLSAAGKSTIAIEAENRLFHLGFQVYVLDGDNIRRGLATDLGFSHEDRTENIRRAGEVAALFAEAGFIVISAFISPYRQDRAGARAAAGEGSFHEVYVKASLEACEKRDPKGLYRRARAGEIEDFTGISAPYEEPEHSELVIDTEKLAPEEAVEAFVDYCRQAVSVERGQSETGG